ncbi:hypothetical protein V5O48_016256 [Marasmius crinis-equi]|uniref:AMP-dependent synthetase/ligase domain-containing protein n=1 Tax=Marasmius crinis-equi TaxID=585013 RepID=A0ABR3ES99_9AGAR
MLNSPLTALHTTASEQPNAPAFKIPITDPDPKTGRVADWRVISYTQFAKDVNTLADLWDRVLRKDGVDKGAVVALCLGGFAYLDVVHLYSIAKAGYVPHMFSRLPDIEIVKELLRESDTKALIRSDRFKKVLEPVVGMGIPVYDLANPLEDSGRGDLDRVMTTESDNPDDVFMLAHSSGSTSGRPKLVRFTRRWMDSMIQKRNHPSFRATSTRTTNWIKRPFQGECMPYSTICTPVTSANVAQGCCTIQPSDPQHPYDFQELIDCIRGASLNYVSLFCPVLIKLLRLARSDPEVLEMLKGLDCITGGGASLPKAEVEWAAGVGLNVRILFGLTEVGMALATEGTRYDPTGTFYVLDSPGISYSFDPVPGEDRLLELVVRSDSVDCPGKELRSKEDGHFHTGDLWAEVEHAKPDGDAGSGKTRKGYWYRGRDDDWIKGEYALRCDTKAIEDNLRRTCGDLILECVAVGYGRPSPALLIEPSKGENSDNATADTIQELRQKIFDRIQPFNRLFREHERIVSPDLILIVPRDSLPRTVTKGNVRRKAAEDFFKETLDRAYTTYSSA